MILIQIWPIYRHKTEDSLLISLSPRFPSAVEKNASASAALMVLTVALVPVLSGGVYS